MLYRQTNNELVNLLLTDVVVLVEAQSALVFADFLDAHAVEVVAALEHLDELLVKPEVLFAGVAPVFLRSTA